MGHGGLSRGPNSEDEPFFIADTLLFLRAKVILWLGRAFVGRACVNSRLLHTTLLTSLSNDMPQPCSHTYHVSSSASLCLVNCSIPPSFSPLHLTRLSKWHCKNSSPYPAVIQSQSGEHIWGQNLLDLQTATHLLPLAPVSIGPPCLTIVLAACRQHKLQQLHAG